MKKSRLLYFSLIIALLGSLLSQTQVLAQNADAIDNLLSLKIEGNGYSDQTFVVILPGSTTGFDSNYDAYKLMGIYAAPQIYSIIPCCNLSVNAIPELYTNMTVQLGFRVGYDTSYTITASDMYTFGADTNVVLFDTKLGTYQDLMIDSVYTFTGETTDAEQRFKLIFNYPLKLDLKVFLEGPFNGSSMDANLNSSGLLPLSQPFSGPPWNYSGTETVSSIPNAQIVDWVLIELRDAPDAASADASTVIEKQACFLLSDGSLVALDGSSMPEFYEAVTQQAFIVVMHRNHLPILSANPLTRSSGLYPYDFTTSASQAYGLLALKDKGGVFVMYGGDGNADGIIDMLDKTSFWSALVGHRGYLSADYTLNGQLNNPDKNDIWDENLGEVKQVP